MKSLAAVLDRILDYPWQTLLLVALLMGGLALFIPRVEVDASADSLLLEQDNDLRYYRGIIARYGSDNYLVITYTARSDLFSTKSLDALRRLRDELRGMDRVAKVISILDVPLVNSPGTTLATLQKYVPTLDDPKVDRELARTELLESPIYSNLLMSLDGDTTALLVLLRDDPEYVELIAERDRLREKMLTTDLTADEQRSMDAMSERIKALRSDLNTLEKQDIAQIREILGRYRDGADIHLGGVPMIVSDMIDYILSDVVVFGSAILLFLVVLLAVIFVQPRWIVVAMMCSLSAIVLMLGLLGALNWRLTVVSSNFVALMMIFSLSFTVHLIQRYRELHAQNPRADQRWLVKATMEDLVKPCFYTGITTMVGFASLIVSGIRPVIDFGWMMFIGMIVVMLTAFVIFPAFLLLLRPGKPTDKGDSTQLITGFFAAIVDRRGGLLAGVCIVLAVASVAGMLQLDVENRFIDYFKKETEIYQGMLTIDRDLGGTVPLEVILDADTQFRQQLQARSAEGESSGDEFTDEFSDEFSDELDADFADDPLSDDAPVNNADLGATSYWYNTFRLGQLRAVHDYLDSLPETGKVLSLATTMTMLESLNQDESPGTFFLSVLYNRLPPDLKESLFDPYMSEDGNQVRISMRIFESDPTLQRERLISTIRTHLVEEMGFEADSVHVTGMLVLYNNVLQSLYRSQILTLGVVLLAIMAMFCVLFRSFKLAVIAVVPSTLSVGVILGIMGWFGIPLDIMTITIAAISVGIGVDDSIHYIHRFRQEVAIDDHSTYAMYRSHASVGRAMFYTSVIVIAGFSILAFSNFIPSILFGLLTSLAMLVALLCNLTLLPLLLQRGHMR